MKIETYADTTTGVRIRIDKFSTALKTNLRATITDLTNQLLGQVRGLEPVQTGLLRASTIAYVGADQNSIWGRVRIRPTGSANRTAAAFGALEYGAFRRFPVRSYRRGESVVAAYDRRANIRARRFLRGPAQQMRTHAAEDLQETVDRTVQESNAS